jgi:hypothetical protein
MKLLALFCTVLTLSLNVLHAKEEKFFEGNSRFLAEDTDSVEMIKKQLLYLAYRDVLTKQLQDLGLEVSLFWQRYDEKFEEKFSAEVAKREEANKEKFEADPKLRQKFEESLRDLRLNMLRKFGSLPQAIQSYQIGQISRAPQNPKMRYMKIEAKVNQKVLNRIYYRLVRGASNSKYSRLIIDINYHLVNGTYVDLGVNNERDFTSVVNKHWEDWFKANKPNNVEKIEIASSRDKRLLDEYDNIPKSEIANKVSSGLRNTLLLKLDFSIEKKKHNPDYKEFGFVLKGGMYLVEMDTGRILGHYKIDSVKKEYTQLEYDKLSTALANVVYRLPMGLFTKVGTLIGKLGRVKNSQVVTFYDYKKINEALSLVEKIKTNGIRYNLDVTIEKLEHNRATYLFYLDGNKKQLIELIKFVIERNKDPEKEHKYDIVDSTGSIGVKFY